MAYDWGMVGWRRDIKQSIKLDDTGGAGGDRIVVIIATESKTVAIPD